MKVLKPVIKTVKREYIMQRHSPGNSNEKLEREREVIPDNTQIN